MDMVLADLKQVEVIMTETRSQFCRANIKIVGYIGDTNGCHLNISKILKLFDWPECTYVTAARALTRVCIYYRI